MSLCIGKVSLWGGFGVSVKMTLSVTKPVCVNAPLEDCVVGHVPYNLAKSVSQFLSMDANKSFAKVTSSKVNRGAGYGLEIPVVYSLYGPSPYVEKMKTLVEKLRVDGFL